MIPQLLQPAGDVFKGEVLGDVVDEKGPDGTAIVGRRDGPVALLAGRVPDLRLDGLGVDLDRSRGKLDTDRRLAIEVEFIAREPAE